MINKTAQGTWRVRVKAHGRVVASRTFDRRADAARWEADQKRRLQSGDWIDPKLGQESVGSALARWLVMRQQSVSGKTYQTDEYLTRTYVTKRVVGFPLGSVRSSDVEALLLDASKHVGSGSLVRFRASLSSFFSWCVRERIIVDNPAKAARVPLGRAGEAHEVYPFTVRELHEVYGKLKEESDRWADLALVLGLTGIRWGEAMALRVRDVQDLPYPAIRISRSGPDGQIIRNTTKGGKARTVPLAEELLPIFHAWKQDKGPDELLFANAAGNRTGGKNWTRRVRWAKHARGRRIHDLRHTAATIWLSNGVDPKTVQTWLGHASMTLTVDLYSHFMGTDADIVAIARINAILAEHAGDDSGTISNDTARS
ncbi:tyrosine-type recombinase/integrase [Herbiconiux sp. UC225_62]|uniref:tyrosine-type recombinase/integrase n=1 Tax=Herbiconiux sp. UC225_62 TaxID=3350168 RepID=UPI0036D3F23B